MHPDIYCFNKALFTTSKGQKRIRVPHKDECGAEDIIVSKEKKTMKTGAYTRESILKAKVNIKKTTKNRIKWPSVVGRILNGKRTK